MLLTYRIRQGAAALDLISQIERAKVTQHPNSDIQGIVSEVPETSTVLSQLTARTLDDTTNTDISEVPRPQKTSITSSKRSIDARLRKIIESAAVHHFGPIGAMVCEEYLADPQGDIREIMLAIAQEVGASEFDTRAFFETISNA